VSINDITREIGRRIRNEIADLLNYYVSPIRFSYNSVKRNYSENIRGHYIIATKNGLYILRNGNLYLLRSGSYYGVTLSGKKILVFERLGEIGRVISTTIHSNGKIGPKGESVLFNLSGGCHQIDFIDEKLFITDTYNNRIYSIGSESEHIAYYPRGKLRHGRKSENYAHMNSIFFHNGQYYVYCHNETTKTGRKSEIMVSRDLKKIDKMIPLKDENGHNIAIVNDRIYHCDSMNGTLSVNNKPVFHTDSFTRGLSISTDSILLGGSDFAKREDRDKSGGSLFFLDTEYNLITSAKLPGMVQEIRRLDEPDLGLSMFSM
jgi:hypothetical protein